VKAQQSATANRNPSRVLIISEDLPVPFDRRVWREANTLRDAGYPVAVICRAGKGYEAGHTVIEGIDIFRYPLPIEARRSLGYLAEYLIAFFWQSVLAWRVYFTRGFDAIHACNPPDLIFLVAAPFKLLGKKFIFDHHDLSPELYEAKFGRRGVAYRILLGFERLTFRLADISIATNESFRTVAIRRGRMPASQVFIVRNGPSHEQMQILEAVPSLKCGRPYLVGYVGVMGRQDGVHHLLGAARHVLKEMLRTDVHFGIVGDGPELSSLRSLAKEYGIEDHVTFTGRIPDPELFEMLNTADVCVNSDVFNEMNDKSTMNKIMEYMALGKPIVQFDLAEGRVSAQGASLYARANDEIDLALQIVALLDDPERRKTMGRLGRERIENQLQWKYQAPNLLAAYRALFDVDRNGNEGHSE
jgi:glycosyltransferase involved in cell wall biosynthesis